MVWERYSCLKLHRFYYLNCLVILGGGENAVGHLTVMKKTEVLGKWLLDLC